MPVERADADTGAARDVLERRVGPAFGEGALGLGEQAIVVAAGVGAHRLVHGAPDFSGDKSEAASV